METRIDIVRSYGETVIHPLALLLTVACGIWLIAARRDRAIIPLAIVVCLVPTAQRIVIASLDFSMLRVLILFGWMRILQRGEHQGLKLNQIDYIFIAWMISGTIIHTLRDASVDAFVYRLGFSFDAAGVYFMYRILLRTPGEILSAIDRFLLITIAMVPFLALEWTTGYNAFHIFGGVAEFTGVRDGRFRCQGAFSHPILTGSFGASMLPLAIGIVFSNPARRFRNVAAAGAATFIAVSSASSGPIVALMAGVAAWAVWPLRNRMWSFQLVSLTGLTIVHFIREKPVWHLIGRLSDVIGGTGYHRVRLIDAFIYHFPDWWLLGTNETRYWGWGLQDTTNQFVVEGIRGGLSTFLIFVSLLVACFRAVGRIVNLPQLRRLKKRDRRTLQLLAWSLGACLVAHMASFISVSYFGQLMVVLYLHLAMLASLSGFADDRLATHRRPPGTARPGVHRGEAASDTRGTPLLVRQS